MIRVRAGIGLPAWASRRPPGKARGGRIPGVCKRRATPPGGMHRRPGWQPYSRASPWLVESDGLERKPGRRSQLESLMADSGVRELIIENRHNGERLAMRRVQR